MAALRDLLTAEQTEHFLEMRRRGLSDDLAIRLQNRLSRDMENLDFQRQAARWKYVYGFRVERPAEEYQRLMAEYDEKQAGLYQKVLDGLEKSNVGFVEGTDRDVMSLARSLNVDKAGQYVPLLRPKTLARESLAAQIHEKGVAGFAWDVAKSAVATPVEGAEDMIAGRGWGEHPLEDIAKKGSILPWLRGAGSLASAGLARSGLRAATRSLTPEAEDIIKQLARSNMSPAQMAEALGGVGVNRARAGELLQKAVQHPAWKVPARGVEAADILGAREEVLSEILGELMFEGAAAGGSALYDRAAPATKQELRKTANDQAAAERQAKNNAAKIAAALEADVQLFTNLTHQIATRKTEVTDADIAGISDELFVAVFENQIAPQIQGEIDALEQLGLENAGELIRAEMLSRHQQAKGVTPDEAEATGADGVDADATSTQPPPEQTPEGDSPDQPGAEALPTAEGLPETGETPEAEAETVERSEAELLELEEGAAESLIASIAEMDDPDANVEEIIEQAFTEGVESGDITEAEARLLYPRVLARVQNALKPEPTPEELEAQAQAAAEALVASANRPNAYQIEGLLENQDPIDAETFIEQFGDELPQAYRENPRALDLFLSQLAADEGSRVTATETDDGVRQYTAEVEANEVPEARVGETTVAYASDGVTEFRVRPVLRNLDELVPSHDIDGEQRPDYPQHLQPRGARGGRISLDLARQRAEKTNFDWVLKFFRNLRDGPPLTSKKHPRRSVSGSGRLQMFNIMRQDFPENWQEYQRRLRQELEELGMDPAEADAMEAEGGSPLLTYELVDFVDEVFVARDANEETTLDHTATETAEQDADYFDDDLMGLWQPGTGDFADALKSEANQPFRTALFNRIPTHLVSGFMTADNKNLSNDGIKRIQNAMIQYVFGGEIGDRLSEMFIETELEDADVRSIGTMLRNAVATLAYTKANGQDISQDLASAIFRFIEFNNRADKDTRRVPKEDLLWAELDALYNTAALIDAPSLLEKQILYLIYAKRNAPRQLADDFQAWAASAVTTGAADMFGGAAETATTSEAIFAGIIRDHIETTIFQTQEVDGKTELLPPSSMPPELVNLRTDIDAIPTTEGKAAAVSDWINSFLSVMNEGQEVDTDATPATRPEEVPTPDTQRTGTRIPEGRPPGSDPGTPERPDIEGEPGADLAPSERGRTEGDEPGGAEGGTQRTPPGEVGGAVDTAAIEAALEKVFVGTVSIDEWNAAEATGKRSSLQKSAQSLPMLQQAGTITAEEAAERRAAIELLQRSIEETPDADSEPQTADRDTRKESEANDRSAVRGPIDTNQVVGVSRRRTETQTATSTVSPTVQRALDTLGITPEAWEQLKADGEAEAFLNRQPQDEIEQIDAVVELAGDIAGDLDLDLDAEEDWDLDDDEELFSDVHPGILKDITDEQRSDFETVRRKLFLARTISLLEKKTDKTPIENAQLSALKATQRTDAQQEVYEGLLNRFIDRQVDRLKAKNDLTSTEERILDALAAVQAEGLPEEASELSLYADLDTPDQAHSSPLSETRTLAGVQPPDTSETTLNLPKAVVSDRNKLSPAQQTGVKAILAAFKRKIHTTTDTTVQGGFLLGDKPGVGKTRQALATLWHYMREGIEKHFVLAPNQQLLDNYAKDFDAMGGPGKNISNYNSQNQKPSTPIATATYATLIRTPKLEGFATDVGNQNAIADIVEHLTGVRPGFNETHPEAHQAQVEAFTRILPNMRGTQLSVENVMAELRRQAERVNLDNPQAVDQFRRRVTPTLANLLLSERSEAVQQQVFQQGAEITVGTDLDVAVAKLLTYGETHLATGSPDTFAAAVAAFDGVIVLDEMHKAAGTNSQTGNMIETLHRLLPNARFLYMSATPFKEIGNFRVAERLGLWGANQAFPSFRHFFQNFRRAARATKEVIPLHLKQIGRYFSRALSSKETRYSPVEVPLTETERKQYDTAVRLVNGIQQRFEGALDQALRSRWGVLLGDAEGAYRAKYMRAFYNATQNFYLALLDSMKAQGLAPQIQDQLKNGDKIIVQLENTWDATIRRAQARGQTTAGPFDLLIDFVSNANLFPVHEHIPEVRRRSDGTDYVVATPRMEYNSEGQQVRAIDPTLKQLQENLIAALHSEMNSSVFTAGLRFAADIIHTAALDAGVASGEISGRNQVYPENNPTPMPQDKDSKIERSTQFSETTDLNLIVLGPAGLTGINLPVSEKIRNKIGNLYHYLVQSSWNVNTFEQGLGRGKRANSAIDPHYIVAYQDMPGADRVLGATLAKFAEMGALAGQADSALMQNVDKVEGETRLDDDPEADVFEDTQGQRGFVFGPHGQEALEQLWLDMANTQEFGIADALGLPHPEIDASTGYLVQETLPNIKSFFQRLLHQTTENQPGIYKEFEQRLKRILTHRKELGTLDTGANDLDSKDGVITDRLTIYTDPDTGQTAEMVKLDVQRKLPRRSWEYTQKVLNQEPGYEHHGGQYFIGFYQDTAENIWAVFENPFSDGGETSFTRWGPRGTPVPGLHQGEARMITDHLMEMSHVDADAAARLWRDEDATADTFVDSEIFMATGLILPKWNDLQTGRFDAPVMGVIPMQDGSNLHGRVIPAAAVSEVLRKIGGVNPNHFEDGGSTQALPDDPNIDIPQLVRDIIGQQTDTQIANRLQGIVDHIHNKLPLMLRGHLVRSAAEAAVLGQLIRDPQVEHTWIVYQREGRILKIEPMSLSRKGETKAGDFKHIKAVAAEEGADAIMRIHNHPSGVAKWSREDKLAAQQWHRELGTLMAEDIIVDSGTFAYRTFENGKYTWHEDVELDPDMVGWRTDSPPMPTGSNMDMGEQRPTDVLYQNPLIRGARDAATYMWGLKHSTNVAELVYVDIKTGRITKTYTDTSLRTVSDPAQYMQSALMSAKGQHVHVMMWGAANSVAEAIQNVEGVDSVWIGSQRYTGLAEIASEKSASADIASREGFSPRKSGESQAEGNDLTVSASLSNPDFSAGRSQETVTDNTLSDVSRRRFLKTLGKGIAGLVAANVPGAKQALAQLDSTVETIVSHSGKSIKKQVGNVYGNIRKGAPLNLIGHKAQSAEEIAVLAQVYRNPFAETTHLIYMKDGEIFDHTGWTFNHRGQAPAPNEKDILDYINAQNIDSVYVVHNHPSGKAAVSEGDRWVAGQYAHAFGDKFGDFIVINSGTYARAARDAEGGLVWSDGDSRSGDLQFEEEIYLTEAQLGWDPQRPLKGLHRRLYDLTKVHLDDPVQQNRQPDENIQFTLDRHAYLNKNKTPEERRVGSEAHKRYEKERIENIARFINRFKTQGGWSTLVMTDSEHQIRAIAAYQGLDTLGDNALELFIGEETNFYGATNAYISADADVDTDIFRYRKLPNGKWKNIRGVRGVWKAGVPQTLIREPSVTPSGDTYVPVREPTQTILGRKQTDTSSGRKREFESGDAYILRDYQPEGNPYTLPSKDELNLQGTGKTRRFVSPRSELFEKLRLWTPKLRKQARNLGGALRSGYGKINEIKSKTDQPAPGDIIEHYINERMHISQVGTGRARSALMPVLKKLNAQVKRAGGEDATALRSQVDHDIINFIEYNTPLPSRSQNYQSVATELKETWRKVNQAYVEAMIEMIRDLAKNDEVVTKTGTQGRVKWSPEPLGDLVWTWELNDSDGKAGAFIRSADLKALKRKKAEGDQQQQQFIDVSDAVKTYTVAEAFAETDQLWYPHQYDRSRLRHYHRTLEKLIRGLNQLAAQGENATEKELEAVGITKVVGGYRHDRARRTFPDIDSVIKYYTEIANRTQSFINMYDDGTIGLYPHLERVRETHDRLYRRDTNVLMSTTALLWDRYAEIKTFGQIDDFSKLPPRLAQMLEMIDFYSANAREAALMKVIEGLHGTKESRIAADDDTADWGMHESIPAFEGGERAALDIMQMWEDYYLVDDKGNRLPSGQRHYTDSKGNRVEGEKVKTGQWKGIDINRLGLDQYTLSVLENIGFIAPDRQGGWQVRGKTDAAQQRTIARFFVELMQTKASRRDRIKELVKALGHWQDKDPLEAEGGEIARQLNTATSFAALGWKQALQNLTEVPQVEMLVGTKSTKEMVSNMRDPEFRAAALELVQGLKQGIEFLADDNMQERYLNSKWSGFGSTERISRMVGVAAGLTHAKNLTKELLASQADSKNRARIEREMRRLRMNPNTLSQVSAGEVDAIFEEVIARIKSGDIELAGIDAPSAAPANNPLTDPIGAEWVRMAMYVSDTVFKPYDARTLPNIFNSTDPRLRVFLKFKGWMLQQNRFMFDQYKHAFSELRKGNYLPLSRMLVGTAMLTGTMAANLALFSALQGWDDDDENKTLRAFLQTQTLGLTAVLWEMAIRSEGNPWRLEKTVEGTIVGPVWGIFVDTLVPAATGDVNRSMQEVLQRTPVAREALYLGGNRWWEEEE